MQNPLMQTIEALAKEKGIEAETIITAIEDAVLTASRKYYKTNENLKTRFNPETGQVDLFAIKHIVSGRRGPGHADLAEGSAGALRRGSRSRHGDRVPEAHRRARPHRRADGQAGDLPEGPRGRAREHLRRVQPARRRGHQQHGQAVRERRPDRRDRPRRGGAAAQGAVARRKLHARRAHPRRHQGREPQREGAADRPVAHRPGAADQAVRAGSAGDLRRHRDDSRRRARSGRPREGGGLLARARRRPGRRLRRHEGHARPGDHPRAARREDRHRRVVRRPDPVRHQRAQPGQGAARLDRRRQGARDGGGRRGQAAVARHRQEGPERPAGGQADRLADRHQERGREAPRGRGAVRRARARRGRRRRRRRDGGGSRRAVRRGRAPPKPAAAAGGARQSAVAADEAEAADQARSSRRGRGRAKADASDAENRRQVKAKESIWQRFGFTRSRSCSARRARKCWRCSSAITASS